MLGCVDVMCKMMIMIVKNHIKGIGEKIERSKKDKENNAHNPSKSYLNMWRAGDAGEDGVGS